MAHDPPPEPHERPARDTSRYRETAEAAWRWVLDQVHWDDGPWVPTTVVPGQVPAPPEKAAYRDGMHEGIGGLALVLAEMHATRAWTVEEAKLADAIVDRLQGAVAAQVDCTYFDGLVSTVHVLTALGATGAIGTAGTAGAGAAVARLLELAEPDGWPQTVVGPPRYLPEARLNDLTLGTAGVLLGAVWAHRHGVVGAAELADRAATVLLAEAEDLPTGTNWRFVPRRFRVDSAEEQQMPNLSHGLAGIVTALALAGTELDRPDLTEAARRGAEHLMTLGDRSGAGFTLPHVMPRGSFDGEDVTYTWCQGPTGTSLAFLALDRAGLTDFAGEPPGAWQRRCLNSVSASGLPARLRPGFWDNDGMCCGTAGVGDVVLDSWHLLGRDDDLERALLLADTLVDRAVVDGPHAYWRFIEHRNADPILPPGVGWMQGAAGIAAYLFHASRVADQGAAAVAVPRMDTWWSLPTGRTDGHQRAHP